MIGYIDASVVLRRILGEPLPLKEPKGLKSLVANEFISVECFRTVDRIRLYLQLSDEEIAFRLKVLHDALTRIRLIRMSSSIIRRACAPLPVILKSLDALHLVSASMLREAQDNKTMMFLTHDANLGRAAEALGFRVLGCEK